MDDPDKMVDLAPYEWRSERAKPREPILGPMAKPVAILFVSGLVIAAIARWLVEALKAAW